MTLMAIHYWMTMMMVVVVILIGRGRIFSKTPSVPYRSISRIGRKAPYPPMFYGRRGQGWATQFLTPFTRWAANAKPDRGGRSCSVGAPGLSTTVVAASLPGLPLLGQTEHIARSMAEFIRRKWDQIGRRIAPT